MATQKISTENIINNSFTKSVILRLEEDIEPRKDSDITITEQKVLNDNSFDYKERFNFTKFVDDKTFTANKRMLLVALNKEYPNHKIYICLKNVKCNTYENKINSYNFDINFDSKNDVIYCTPKFWFDIKYDEEKKELEREDL